MKFISVVRLILVLFGKNIKISFRVILYGDQNDVFPCNEF